MDKQQLLVLAKQDMKQVVDEITLSSLQESQEKLFTYFDFLQGVKRLPIVTLPNVKELTTEEKLEKVQPIIDTFFDEPEVTEPVKVAYRFERKTKGGMLPEINAFVPEKIVRELELQYGDLVFAKKIDTQERSDGPTRYEFEVAEYRNEPQPHNRVQINYAIVTYDKLLGRFVCEKSISGQYIRLGEVMHTVLLNEKEVIDFQIKDGDIVDLAYMTNQTNNIRVIWRYTIDQQSEFNEVTKPATKKKTDKVKKEYPQVLEGKTVLMIGFEPGRPSMQEEVEWRGGELMWSSGREGHDRMFTMVNKSDCIINMLEHMGHRGSTSAVEIAKTLNIPHGKLHTFGRSSFIQEVYRCLNIESAE